MGKQSTGIGSNAHKSCVSKTQLSGITDYQIQGKRCDNVHTDGTRRPVSSLDRFPVEERICTTTKIAITMPYVIKLFFVVLFIFFFISATSYFLLDVLAEQTDGFTSSTMIKTANTNCICNLRGNIGLTENLNNTKENSSNHCSWDRTYSTEYCRYESLDTRHCAV